jgi:hypothetical protein
MGGVGAGHAPDLKNFQQEAQPFFVLFFVGLCRPQKIIKNRFLPKRSNISKINPKGAQGFWISIFIQIS